MRYIIYKETIILWIVLIIDFWDLINRNYVLNIPYLFLTLTSFQEIHVCWKQMGNTNGALTTLITGKQCIKPLKYLFQHYLIFFIFSYLFRGTLRIIFYL